MRIGADKNQFSGSHGQSNERKHNEDENSKVNGLTVDLANDALILLYIPLNEAQVLNVSPVKDVEKVSNISRNHSDKYVKKYIVSKG